MHPEWLTGCERGVARAPAPLSARLYANTQAALGRHRPALQSVAHWEPRSRRTLWMFYPFGPEVTGIGPGWIGTGRSADKERAS
jgi:hypothetical protein